MEQIWKLKIGLGKQMKFWEMFATKTIIPKMVLVLETSKQIILLEITIFEEYCITRQMKKKSGIIQNQRVET